MAVGRGGLDRAHVARAGEGEIKRARDRRGGEGEDIDETEELFELLLLFHAESLLLIDDNEAEVLKFHVLRQQAVCADDDIDGAVGQSGDGAALAFGGLQAAEAIDPDRIGGESFAQVFPMLFRENGSGDEEGDLLAVLHRLEDGADGHFGFAEADVAADEAVHAGRRALHVTFGLEDRS